MKIKLFPVFTAMSALFFAVAILAISFTLANQTSVLAGKDLTGEELFQTETELATESAKVDYYLAYPGILADHPLYWLKMIRDRVWLLVARNSIIKTERLLLYADKRIGAAQMLMSKGKTNLSITTVTKAEKYLERAILEWQKTKETPLLKEKLQKALLKHLEILDEMTALVSSEHKAVLEKTKLKLRQWSDLLN